MHDFWQGVFTAIVTPFRDGKVDEKALAALVERQLAAGVNGIVACGSTGEAATLSSVERFKVVKIVCHLAQGKMPVLAGAGTNATASTIENAKLLEEAGADGLLIVSPYYNKPTPEGLYGHFKALSEHTSLPVMVYNVPSRTGSNVLPATMMRLAEIKGVEAVKEASGDVSQIGELIRLAGAKLKVLSGDDGLTFPVMALGALGVVSVTSNVAPAKVKAMVDAALAGRMDEARSLHHELEPLNRAMFLQTNPLPVKTALAMMGLVAEEFRLPLCPMDRPQRDALAVELKKHGLVP